MLDEDQKRHATTVWMKVTDSRPESHREECLSKFPGEGFDWYYDRMFVWPTKDGRQIHIFSLDDQHLLNILNMLHMLKRQYQHYIKALHLFFNGPIPSGDGALMAYENEFKQLALHPKMDPARLPIYQPLIREVTRRKLQVPPV